MPLTLVIINIKPTLALPHVGSFILMIVTALVIALHLLACRFTSFRSRSFNLGSVLLCTTSDDQHFFLLIYVPIWF